MKDGSSWCFLDPLLSLRWKFSVFVFFRLFFIWYMLKLVTIGEILINLIMRRIYHLLGVNLWIFLFFYLFLIFDTCYDVEIKENYAVVWTSLSFIYTSWHKHPSNLLLTADLHEEQTNQKENTLTGKIAPRYLQQSDKTPYVHVSPADNNSTQSLVISAPPNIAVSLVSCLSCTHHTESFVL